MDAHVALEFARVGSRAALYKEHAVRVWCTLVLGLPVARALSGADSGRRHPLRSPSEQSEHGAKLGERSLPGDEEVLDEACPELRDH